MVPNRQTKLYESLMLQKKLRGLKDLYFFNRQILEQDEERRKFIVPHVHGDWTRWHQESKSRIKLILVPRNTFKCVRWDTKIQMADGTLKKIEDVVVGDRVVGYKNYKPVVSVITNKSIKRKDRLYKINFNGGREIFVTKEHKFFNLDNYRSLPTYSAIPRYLNIPEPKHKILDDDIKLIVYFVTEGCYSTCGITNMNQEVQEDLKEAVENKGWKLVELRKGHFRISSDWKHKGNTFRNWLRKYGLWGKSAFEKKLPDEVMSLPTYKLKLVISLLFATDGSINVSKNGAVGINYCSVNKDLCEQVMVILSRFGIYSSLRKSNSFYYKDDKKVGKIAYYVYVEGNINRRKFLNKFTVLGKDRDMELARKEMVKKSDDYRSLSELFPREIRSKIKETGLSLRKSGIRIDNSYRVSRQKIAKIPSIASYAKKNVNWLWTKSCDYWGEDSVYDIETTSGNYVANGLIVHNSTFFTVGWSLQNIAKSRDIRILIANATLSNSQRFLGEIQRHIRENEEFKTLYGDLYDPKLKWNENEFVVAGRKLGKPEATVTAAGVGGNLVSQHYDIIIADDLVNNENSSTRYMADKTIDWWKRSLSLLEPEGEMIIIGTRWSYYELYAHIIEKFSDVDKYIRGAYNPDGSFYFPERFDDAKLKELRKLHGSWIFSSFYLNDPIDEKSAIIKKSHLRYYGKKEEVRLPANVATFACCDPAVSQEVTADYSSITVVSIDLDLNWYVREIRRGRWTVGELIENLFAVYKDWSPLSMSIEVVGQAQMLLDPVHNEEVNRNVFLPLVEIKARNQLRKEQRIRAILQPRFERGKIYIKRGMEDLEEELLRFPKAKHDDIIDSLTDIAEIGFAPDEREEKPREAKSYFETQVLQIKKKDAPYCDETLGEYL